MRKQLFCFAMLSMILFTACGAAESVKTPKKEGVAGIVEELYHSDYEYEKTVQSIGMLSDPDTGEVVEKNAELTVVYRGKVIADPYQEYIQVVSASGPTLWTELYHSEEGFRGKTQIRTDEGIVDQPNFEREYPYGYGQEISYELDREETVDGTLCQVYRAQYTRNIGGEVLRQDAEELEATVTQEYYIDKEKKQPVMIVTDLEDLSRKNAMANDMQMNQVSLEEAEKRAAEEDYRPTETLKIFRYQETIEISPLE